MLNKHIIMSVIKLYFESYKNGIAMDLKMIKNKYVVKMYHEFSH